MMRAKLLFTTAAFISLTSVSVQGVPPTVSNIHAAQRQGTKLVDIWYNVADPDSSSLTIQIEISSNSGQSYDLPVKSVTGAIGGGVSPGTNRQITWNAGQDWNGNFSSTCRVRLYAYDNSTPVPPLGMVHIPAGTFVMGWESPSSIGGYVTLSKAYFMERYEVTGDLWNAIRDWGNANGYSISSGAFTASGHPVRDVSWHDIVKWCNARSQKEGLPLCYFTDSTKTVPYKEGALDLSNAAVNWNSSGYRLPTEAEWERAARGGLDRNAYPWGHTIDNHQANFLSSGDPFDNGTTPVGYFNGNQIPPGLNMANGYGLYDVAGNLAELCWDHSGGNPPYGLTDPLGPDNGGSVRLLRGGSWGNPAPALTCAYREGMPANARYPHAGFRCARGQ